MAKTAAGKTLTVFAIVIAVLLICLTAISVFFFLKEVEIRKAVEYELEQVRTVEAGLRADLQDTRRRVEILQGENTELNERMESMVEDLDFEKGLNEELKKQQNDLKKTIDELTRAADKLETTLGEDLTAAEEKINALQEKVDLAEQRNQQLAEENEKMRSEVENAVPAAGASPGQEAGPMTEGVELDTIVINPEKDQGRVMNVDTEADFVILNLGKEHGVEEGTVLSIYRGDTYLGDVTVNRLLDEMSAADIVAPLTAEEIRVEDRVIIKQ